MGRVKRLDPERHEVDRYSFESDGTGEHSSLADVLEDAAAFIGGLDRSRSVMDVDVGYADEFGIWWVNVFVDVPQAVPGEGEGDE